MPGRDSKEPIAWLTHRDRNWRFNVAYATFDLSGPYRSVFDATLPYATQVADPFHVVNVRHEALRYRGRVRDPPLRVVAAVR